MGKGLKKKKTCKEEEEIVFFKASILLDEKLLGCQSGQVRKMDIWELELRYV